jgi:hypothetical protein
MGSTPLKVETRVRTPLGLPVQKPRSRGVLGPKVALRQFGMWPNRWPKSSQGSQRGPHPRGPRRSSGDGPKAPCGDVGTTAIEREAPPSIFHPRIFRVGGVTSFGPSPWLQELQPKPGCDPLSHEIDAVVRYRSAFPEEIEARIDLHRSESADAPTR